MSEHQCPTCGRFWQPKVEDRLVRRAIRASAEAFGVSVADLRGKARDEHTAAARILTYGVLAAIGCDKVQIAGALRRTHGAVVHGLRRVDHYRADGWEWDWREVMRLLGGQERAA